MNPITPPEFSIIGLDSASFKLVSEKNSEYHGSCPHCGGKDRFAIFTHRNFPSWWFFCRQCGIEGWIDQLNPSLKQELTAEQKSEWAKQAAEMKRLRAEQEEQRKREIDLRLSDLTSKEIWEAYHRRMEQQQREWWKSQGIEEDWQDFWSLGFIKDKQYKDGNNMYISDAYTIPYFRWKDGKKSFVTMQYRLTNPHDPSDKYRFEYGLGSSYFATRYDEPLKDIVIICEGAKKAMVLCSWLSPKASVLAIPSKNNYASIDRAVKDCGCVWIVLDPDAKDNAIELAKTIGKNAKPLFLPFKLDDGILHHGFTSGSMVKAMRQQRTR